MKFILSGCNGAMGRALTDAVIEREKETIIAGIDRTPDKCKSTYPVYRTFKELENISIEADAIIDFSHPFYLDQILEYAKSKKIPIVLATTAYSEEDKKRIVEASNIIPIVFSHNTSRGLHVLLKLASMAALLMKDYDLEIVEKHSRNKLDSPSGTSHMIVEALEESLGSQLEEVYNRKDCENARKPGQIGIHSLRAGGNKSEHILSFTTMSDMIEIRHTCFSYDIFAEGAIDAAAFLIGKEPGLYEMGETIM